MSGLRLAPFLQGWIVLAATSGPGQELRIAYQGIGASIRKDFPTLDRCVLFSTLSTIVFLYLTVRPLHRSGTLLGASLPALASYETLSNTSDPTLALAQIQAAINTAQGYHAYSFVGDNSLILLVESVQFTLCA